jgi:hypothetical protein
LIQNATLNGDLSLVGAQIGSHFKAINTKGPHKIDLPHARVEGFVAVVGCRLADLNLRSSQIGGQINVAGSEIEKSADMEMVKCGENVFLRGESVLGSVSFRDARIQGTLDSSKSRFRQLLDLDGLRVGYLWLKNSATFSEGVRATYTRIDQNVDLSGATFQGRVDFAGAIVGGHFVLQGDKSLEGQWVEGSELSLIGSAADTFQLGATPNDPHSFWPRVVWLTDFRYKRLALNATAIDHKRSRRRASVIARWLGRDAGNSMQPFLQASTVLSGEGDTATANAILYQGRERRRRNAKGLRRLGDEALRATIGYGIGYRYFRVLVWVAIACWIGSAVFGPSVSNVKPSRLSPFLFSLDQLLPIIKLWPGGDDIAKTIVGWRHVYLCVHRALGFLMGTFVIAGLSGLTKK